VPLLSFAGTSSAALRLALNLTVSAEATELTNRITASESPAQLIQNRAFFMLCPSILLKSNYGLGRKGTQPVHQDLLGREVIRKYRTAPPTRRLCRPAFESPETESYDHLDVAPEMGGTRAIGEHWRPLKEQGKMSPWQRPCFGSPEPHTYCEPSPAGTPDSPRTVRLTH
jgi:hypothetical protein